MTVEIDPAGTLVADLRRHDRDRFLATLFAPAEHRPALWALLAFNLEIARVRETVSQPILGQIRLQWWRDAVSEIYEGRPVRRHAVTTPLGVAVERFGIARIDLDAMIDGRERDLDEESPGTVAALEDYAEATSSRLLYAELTVLGAADPASIEAARHAGIAWALIGLIRATPYHAARNRRYVPSELSSDLPTACRALAERARFHLDAVAGSRASAPLLPVRVARRYLAVIGKCGFDPCAPAVQLPDPLGAARMWLAHVRGRL